MSGQLGLFAPIAPSIEGIDQVKALASYSCDVIGMSGRVRRAVLHRGDLWVNTGSHGTRVDRTAEMYLLVAVSDFNGIPTTYNEKTSMWRDGDTYPGDYARNDPNGFYHGMTVKSGSTTYVLCGPPQQFAVNPLVDVLATTDEDEDEEYEDAEWSEDDE